jgi:gamma-glutamyltranspeptidase/glutathione hydrolase
MRPLSALLTMTLAVQGLLAQEPSNLLGRGARGRNGVVATAKPEASQVGIDILKRGGNAVDAAIAAAFAMGVLEPDTNGLGGGGFMIIRLASMKEAVVIDFRETAPAAATPGMFKLDERGRILDHAGTEGGLSVGVPGDVAGLLHALEHFGSKKLSRAQILQPAIHWATRGVPVTPNLDRNTKDSLDKIIRFEPCAQAFLQDGLPYEVGERIKNPDLAATLRLLAAKGADAFYKGDLAARIAAEVQKRGGLLTAQDLAQYTVKVRRPVAGSYRGYTILSVPPASSGGTHLIELLNVMETFDLKALGRDSGAAAHLWSEAMKLVFADREKYMADTDFTQVPLNGLLAKGYARELAARISPTECLTAPAAGDPTRFESGSTTHLSVLDRKGNMVAITKSIGMLFGSGVMVPGTGILLNDHMSDFVPKPGSINSIEPGKRPLSSISPALVLDPKGRSFMTIGSPGATRIFTTVAQVISAVIDFGLPLQEAISAPRLAQMNAGNLSLEARIPEATQKVLTDLGHKLTLRGAWDPYFGGVQAVLSEGKGRPLVGGADPRRDGQACAY